MNFRIRSTKSPLARVIEIGVAHLAAGRAAAAGDTVRAEGTFIRTWTCVEGEPGTALDDALAELRAAWGEAGPVHVVIPAHQVLTKLLRVPATAAAQRDRIVAFEARQAIPFPLEEVVWDYALLEDDGAELSVLLAAAKTEAVLELLDRVRAQGFVPVSVIPAGVALATAWQRHGTGAEAALVLGLGARSTQLLLVDGARRQMRTLALGGNLVSRTIGERLEQSAAEADRLKERVLGGTVELPPDSPAGTAVREAAGQYRQRLLAEINRSLLMQQRQENGVDPARVWLTGGAALTPELAEAMTERLGKPAARWTIPNESGGAGTDLADRAEWWGGAHEALSGAPQINLLPAALADAQAARLRRPRWYVAAALLVVALALPGLHFQRLAAARLEAARQLSLRAGPHQVLQARIQDDVAAVEALAVRGREMAELVAARGAWTRLLADLTQRLATVDDTWLERMQVLPPAQGETAARLRVSGRLLDRENPLSRVSPAAYEQATALLQGLVESPFVTAIEGERFDAADPGILRFDFTLVLNPASAL